jgi:hypothetical protein
MTNRASLRNEYDVNFKNEQLKQRPNEKSNSGGLFFVSNDVIKGILPPAFKAHPVQYLVATKLSSLKRTLQSTAFTSAKRT